MRENPTAAICIWPKTFSVYSAWFSNSLIVSVLKWRHNERDGVSNHQPYDCLLNRLFRRRSKKTSKLHATGLCEGNSPVTDEFPAQRASNTENVSIWWRHHGVTRCWLDFCNSGLWYTCKYFHSHTSYESNLKYLAIVYIDILLVIPGELFHVYDEWIMTLNKGNEILMGFVTERKLKHWSESMTD